MSRPLTPFGQARGLRVKSSPSITSSTNAWRIKRALSHRERFKDYKNFAPKLKEILGAETDIKKLRSDDFQRMRRKLAEKVSLITLANRIRNAKVFIYHAHKEAMVDAPLPVGTALKNPPKGQMRVAKRARKYVFSIDELHRLYGTASRRMKCFILLGINAALGNKDVGSLRFKDLGQRWY